MYKIINQLFYARGVCATQNVRGFHSSAPLCFHFVKKQVTVDPEVARIRENRKRRKLEKAINELRKFGKKPKPVEELQIDIKLRPTLKDRVREKVPLTDEEQYERVRVVKEYSRSRARLAAKEINWIRQSIESQKQALTLLKHLSPELYEAAVQPDPKMLPLHIEGPPMTPPLADYKSPDGDYIDVTRKWVQPTMPELIKKYGIGKLLKTPDFKKKQEQMQRKQPNQKPTYDEFEDEKEEEQTATA